MNKIYYLFALSGSLLLSNLAFAQDKPTKFIDRANMNLSVKPGDDFFEYSNGIWTKNNPIPAKETRWGTFNQLRDFNINAVKTILEDAVQNLNKYAPGSPERRVAEFYTAAMDSIRIEKLGYEPIKPELAKIDAIQTKIEALQAVSRFKTEGLGSPLYGFYISQDRKNVEKMAPQLGQGGTSLPDRDYYLKTDSRSVKIQDAFKKYISTLFELSGTPSAEAKANAETVYALEKSLASAQMSRVEMRDPYKTYNKLLWSTFQS